MEQISNRFCFEQENLIIHFEFTWFWITTHYYVAELASFYSNGERKEILSTIQIGQYDDLYWKIKNTIFGNKKEYGKLTNQVWVYTQQIVFCFQKCLSINQKKLEECNADLDLYLYEVKKLESLSWSDSLIETCTCKLHLDSEISWKWFF